jgi:hypothetical protein
MTHDSLFVFGLNGPPGLRFGHIAASLRACAGKNRSKNPPCHTGPADLVLCSRMQNDNEENGKGTG